MRLDIWHFMRRLAGGCTSESYLLYGVFMSRVSSAIFEWGRDDYEKLVSAKLGELRNAGVLASKREAAQNAISLKELARHCRRRTRGNSMTTRLLEELIESMREATDPLGVPLLRSEMGEIWKEQKRHIPCLQDPSGVDLYTKTRELTKGEVKLPILRCARGSTSLESFHLHLAKFILGSSANAVHYQAYLLDGLTRWNAKRSAAATESSVKESLTLRSFNSDLQQSYQCLMLTTLLKRYHKADRREIEHRMGIN